ncbi:efflux RND transporter periplasmic adaptor subunit [Neomegalonema sp.]|uniref:efflux RND transporter periplasmic adaptor subunit n=1 Tax=Neomegalonema sp. TaxID=2039713 RepID=UPI00260C8992|nr:efflux RND transporter periplasmic adaptor subunit [Neomegalonema sp.]MDD2868326.1 efflux RND transporter periplasmic adaptor subunit [Neomegalonema sp.]
MSSSLFRTLLLLGVLLSAASHARAQGFGDMPPPVVGVMVLKGETTPIVNEMPGRISATRVSEVRARVTGVIQERVFEQGARVERGQVLYRIDPRLFRVRVASAEASLQKAQAALSNARVQLDRQITLRRSNVASAAQYDAAAVAVQLAEADLALAQTVLEEARINLDYTEVRAPISGVIGAALVTEGALAAADGGQNLALIQQLDPIYADFTQSAQELLSLRRAVASGDLASPSANEAQVELAFDDGSVYERKGRLLFANAGVDASTGQVTLRAEFPNPRGDLLPGMYVRVKLTQGLRRDAIVIPQRAVQRGASGASQVYVVGADGSAEARPVRLGRVIDGGWLVEEGLRSGETIVVDGVGKVRPGGKVSPQPWTQEASR